MFRFLLDALHGILTGLVRRTWLVGVVTVMVCAVFAARAVAALIEADHLADDRTVAAPVPRPIQPAELPRITPVDPDVLVERNIFCSTCVIEPGPAKSCRGEPTVLIATSLGRAPTATLRVLATEVQGSWGIGETIPSVGRVDRIGATSIDVVEAAGRRCRLSLYEPKAGDHVAGAATPVPDVPADPFAERIRKLSDSSYEVDRQLVRDLVSGTTQSGGVRAFPIMKNQEVAGLRLAGVRPGTVAAAIGLRSGDVIAAVDGDTIRNMQQLLDLYGKLDRIDAVELSGTRSGKPLALTLRLR